MIGAAIFCCCVLLGASAAALDRDRSISQFEHRVWRSRDGAPSQIHALAQTTDGYLWIGSAQGLFRFDAVTFEEYVPQPGVTLPSHNIYALMATPDGALWVAFRPSGVGVLKNGILTVFRGDDEPSDPRIHSFARDHQGRIWAGSEAGLFVREGSRWRAVGREWDLPSEMIRALFVDRQGTLWVATVTSISRLSRGSTRFEPAPADVGRDVTTFAQSKDGRVWFAADQSGIARPVPLEASGSGPRDPAVVSATCEVGHSSPRRPASAHGHRASFARRTGTCGGVATRDCGASVGRGSSTSRCQPASCTISSTRFSRVMPTVGSG